MSYTYDYVVETLSFYHRVLQQAQRQQYSRQERLTFISIVSQVVDDLYQHQIIKLKQHDDALYRDAHHRVAKLIKQQQASWEDLHRHPIDQSSLLFEEVGTYIRDILPTQRLFPAVLSTALDQTFLASGVRYLVYRDSPTATVFVMPLCDETEFMAFDYNGRKWLMSDAFHYAAQHMVKASQLEALVVRLTVSPEYEAHGPVRLQICQPICEASPISSSLLNAVLGRIGARGCLIHQQPVRRYSCESLTRTQPLRNTCEPEALIQRIDQEELLLAHPFDSFDVVLTFLSFAVCDPRVQTIYQTLYRTASNSQIVRRLIEAATNGKHVFVCVEPLARGDECKNATVLKDLQAAGVHVTVGYASHKVHAKYLLFDFHEGGSVRYYLHASTGNYNETTATRYTDLSLLTSEKETTHVARAFFQAVHSKEAPPVHFGVRQALYEQFDRCLADPVGASISIKCNALTDLALIQRLYELDQAGVTIQLHVRGACFLDMSKTTRTTVRSTVGLYLEHSRYAIFTVNNQSRYFIMSADLMPRNLDERLESFIALTGEKAIQFLIDYDKCYSVLHARHHRLRPHQLWETVHPNWQANAQDHLEALCAHPDRVENEGGILHDTSFKLFK